MPQAKRYYGKLTGPMVDPRFGKMPKGRVVPLDEKTYDRWFSHGAIEEASEKDYDEFIKKREEEALGPRRSDLQKLALERSSLWDTSTHRDAMTSSPEGLKRAMDAGVPLVNLEQLRDESGMPLDSGAKVDQILEARSRLATRDPLREHAQASTSGGGSHYYTPAPLNDPNADVKTLASGELDHKQAPTITGEESKRSKKKDD